MAPFEGLCKIYAAGPCNEPNVISIQLTQAEGGAFSDLWFTAPPGKEREFLAVAIAAMTCKRKVLVGTTDVVNWGQLNCLYLVDTSSE